MFYVLKHAVIAQSCSRNRLSHARPYTLLQCCVGNGGGGSGGGGGTVGTATSTYIGGTGEPGPPSPPAAYGGVSLMKALQLHSVHYICCQCVALPSGPTCKLGIQICLLCRMVDTVAAAVVARAPATSEVRLLKASQLYPVHIPPTHLRTQLMSSNSSVFIVFVSQLGRCDSSP